jgi:protein gp37
MSGKSGIQWTAADDGTPGYTWNPVVGCKRVSAGCDHCYAFQLHDQRHIAWKRGRWDAAPKQYHLPFSKVQLLPERLEDPLHWRKPRRVFVNSMSDLFHEDVPGEFINQVWMTMRNAKQHTYQILTKRPERLLEWTQKKARATGWPINEIWPNWMWLGVSVENQAAADERIPLLLETPAAVRFLSCEPLLGPVNIGMRPGYLYPAVVRQWPIDDLNWIIVGGESGPHARRLELSWVESLVDQCRMARVAAFVKQLGTRWAVEHRAHDRHGGDMSEWPEHLRVREYPEIGGGA